MSPFKWESLWRMATQQHLEATTMSALRLYSHNGHPELPITLLQTPTPPTPSVPQHPQLSCGWLQRRLHRIEQEELHAIDTNVAALDVLHIVVDTVSTMLNQGQMLAGVLKLGTYLRTKGQNVDFVKLESWLDRLFLHRMAQLQGSILITVFGFEAEELPFVAHVEPAAERLALRSITHAANDTAEEWHFRQTRAGFVSNNSALLRRNLRRSIRFMAYAPLETVSNFVNSFARSLQEIEE